MPVWRLRDHPIEKKILLAILPICLLPACVFLLLIVIGLWPTFESAMGGELKRQAETLASQFDTFIEERRERQRHAAQVFADDPDGLLREIRAAELADLVVQVHAGESVIWATSPAGEPLARTLREARPLVARLLGENPPPQPGGSFVDYRLPVPGRLDAVPLGGFSFIQPGAVFGTAVGEGSTSITSQLFLLSEAATLVRQFRVRLTRTPDPLMIVNEAGQTVYSTEPLSDSLQQRLGERLRVGGFRRDYFTVYTGGQAMLVTLASPPSLARSRQSQGFESAPLWSFLVRYDMEAFISQRDTLLWLSAMLALVLVLIMVGFATVAARWLVRPLHTLQKQAEELARGNLNVRASVTTRDEIGTLADAFNRMAGQLRGSYQALEERLEENRLHTEHINVINQIGRAIVQALSLDRIFEILQTDLPKLFEFDALWLAILDRNTQELRISLISPPGLIMLFDRGRIPARRSLHQRVISTEEPAHVEIGPNHRDEFFETGLFRSEGLQSFLIAPIPSREGIIGTLTVASTRPDAYNREMTSVISSLAQTVSIALEQAELFQQISHMAGELERKVAERTEELKVATRKLIQTEKYYATGRMAGNLSHEINNPLGIIKNYLHMVRQNLTRSGGGRRATDPNLEHVDIIDQEVNRIARLVRQLLDLHRPTEQRVTPVDINTMLGEVLALLEGDLRRRGIEVERQFDEQMPWPIASPDLIRQVLINLIRNAQDAMEDTGGGTLGIRTSTVTQWVDGRELQVARIRVADTGSGIAAEHLSQIFDPFFTTKAPERGSGLGLCVSYSIVRMYRGSIDVESAPGQGSAFTITLPIIERDSDLSDLPDSELEPLDARP